MAEAREPYGAVAKVMGFPAALGHLGGAEKRLGDIPVARLLEPAVEGAQCQDEALASSGITSVPATAKREGSLTARLWMRYGPLRQQALPRKQGTNSVRGAAAQEMAVAMLRHPTGAR